jgi:anti-sigma-K factor RskA
MKTAPENPELIDRLGAEYVLGTLRGAARRRFARWRETSAIVDGRCGYWEQRLLPLLGPARRAEPSPRVWSAIRLRLGLAAAVARPRRDLPLALAATVLLTTALALLLYWRTPPGRAFEVATIAAPSGSLLWQVEVYGEAGAAAGVKVRAGALSPPPGRDYELWALPKGGAPVSLGVLPYRESTARRALTAAQQRALAGAAQLAVSVEPPGGSPAGQPTGAVVFVAELRIVG